MTLKQIICLVNDIADSQPNVNTILQSGNIYDLNNMPDNIYSVFCLVQGQHTESNGFRNYSFTMYYVDRQKQNGSNKIDIQSTGIDLLANVINTLRRYDEFELNENITYQVFTESFSSLCAGVYSTITISVPIGECSEIF